MKRQVISTLILLFVGISWGVVSPALGHATSCFNCHKSEDFRGKVVHSPVAENRCEQCHSPHVARHEGLLLQEQKTLCFSCHRQTEKRVNGSTVLHQPVKEGACDRCHTPHASAYPGLLSKPGGDLCFSCHEQVKKSYANMHKPFKAGQCDSCHDPHGGSDFRLLKTTGSSLCLGCHKAEAAMKKAHLGRDSRDLDCLGCHHPHGGKERALLREVKHQPFAKGDCQACHGRSQGVDACLGCHREVLATFNHTHSHLQSIDGGNPCNACHNPHVGDRAGLLPANEGQGCRVCHEGTFSRRAKMLHQHPGWNKCSDCHDLHGSDWPGMLKGSPETICGGCHEEHKTFTHPMGDKAPDPRNGVPMNCMTCHDANAGTMYKHFLLGSAERGLCVQCHLSY
jgi:predicted CXXCH cytochrome family protein